VVESGAAAVFPDYTPSPEAQYPTAIEQAYAATKWVGEHGSEIGVDGNKLAVVGNSAGGNMAAVVSLLRLRRDMPADVWPAKRRLGACSCTLAVTNHGSRTRWSHPGLPLLNRPPSPTRNENTPGT